MRINLPKLLQIDPPLTLTQESGNSLEARDQSDNVIFQVVAEQDIDINSIETKRMQWIVMTLNEILNARNTGDTSDGDILRR